MEKPIERVRVFFKRNHMPAIVIADIFLKEGDDIYISRTEVL